MDRARKRMISHHPPYLYSSSLSLGELRTLNEKAWDGESGMNHLCLPHHSPSIFY
jgi:hypothetical protein